MEIKNLVILRKKVKTMKKELKDLIASNKDITDDFIMGAIANALTADSSAAEEEQSEDSTEEDVVEEDSTTGEEEDVPAVKKPAVKEESESLEFLIGKLVDKKINEMRSGKPKPKVKIKPKPKKTKVPEIETGSFQLF